MLFGGVCLGLGIFWSRYVTVEEGALRVGWAFGEQVIPKQELSSFHLGRSRIGARPVVLELASGRTVLVPDNVKNADAFVQHLRAWQIREAAVLERAV